MFNTGQKVTLQNDDGGNSLNDFTVKHRATVIKQVGAFIIMDVENIGVRSATFDYVCPMVTAAVIEERYTG